MNRSRRDVLRGILAAAASFRAPRASGASRLAIDEIHDPAAAWTRSSIRAYRADVVVTLLGIPIYTRQAAGSALAELRERSQDGRRTLSLRFAGGSHPARTHGVNYSGATEEIAINCAGETLESAASFGFVTASPSDESFDEARHRVETGTTGAAYVAVDELHRASYVRVRRAVIATQQSWTADRDDLILGVRAEFARATPAEREIDSPTAVPATFLYTVLAAIRSPERRTSGAYVHNGKRYRLESEKSNARLTGRIHDFEAGRTSTFKLWLDESELPLRIEFSPRSYLRISLEFDRKEES
jgi:hypothetical protein